MQEIGSLLAEFRSAMTNGPRRKIQRVKEWFEITPEESWDLWHWHEGSIARIPIPSSLNECETYTSKISGIWTLDGDQINAKWDNGAIATLKVQNWDPNKVILIRHDSEGVSSGLSARYEGQISRNKIEDGSVTWTWKGSTWRGTWKANWLLPWKSRPNNIQSNNSILMHDE
jgi:hypothetical protein